MHQYCSTQSDNIQCTTTTSQLHQLQLFVDSICLSAARALQSTQKSVMYTSNSQSTSAGLFTLHDRCVFTLHDSACVTSKIVLDQFAVSSKLTSMLRFFAATITSGSSAVSLPTTAATAVVALPLVLLLLLLLLGSTKNCAKRCRLLARSAVEPSACMVYIYI
jgi:hypothetical protein